MQSRGLLDKKAADTVRLLVEGPDTFCWTLRLCQEDCLAKGHDSELGRVNFKFNVWPIDAATITLVSEKLLA